MNKTNQLLQFIYNQIRGYKKNRGNSRRFKSYYMSSKEDTRENSAKIIDYFAGRIFSFFMIFVIGFIRYQQLYLALAFTLAIIIPLHLVSIRIRNKRLALLKKQKRRYIASQKVYHEIMNKTLEELEDYFQEVFQKAGIENLEPRSSNQKVILYEGIYNGEKLMISCHIYKNDHEVELKEVKEVMYQLKVHDLVRVLMVTTSDFTKDCHQYIDNLQKPYRGLLLSREGLLKLIEKNNMFPSEEVIDELVENKISKKEARWEKYKAAMLANKKSKGYFLLSIFLFFTAYYTPYPLYYYGAAGISFSLALITLALKYFNRRNPEEESWNDFNRMLKNL
ncbi:restriction endonuclease [Alkaliphilus crotonatoxidans]